MLNQLRQQVERKMLGLLMICHVRTHNGGQLDRE